MPQEDMQRHLGIQKLIEDFKGKAKEEVKRKDKRIQELAEEKNKIVLAWEEEKTRLQEELKKIEEKTAKLKERNEKKRKMWA